MKIEADECDFGEYAPYEITWRCPHCDVTNIDEVEECCGEDDFDCTCCHKEVEVEWEA